MNQTLTATPMIYAPKTVTLVVTRDWARLIARLQQLENTGARVVLDLDAMTLQVCGKVEYLDRKETHLQE
jgi:hypothetical protein